MKKMTFSEILAHCLDTLEAEGERVEDCLARYPQEAAELEPLLRAAARLRDVPDASPRPAFRRQARARLMQKIAPAESVTFWQRLRHKGQITYTPKRRFAMSWILILTLVGSLLGGGTVYASQSALPGDTLYPVKIGVENARLSLADAEAQTALYQQYAQMRLEEAEALIAEGRYDEVPQMMQAFQQMTQSMLAVAAQSGQQDQAMQSLQNMQAQMLRIEAQLQTRQQKMEQVQDQADAAAQSGLEDAIQAQEETRDMIQDMMGTATPSMGSGSGQGGQGSGGNDGGHGNGGGAGQGNDGDNGANDGSIFNMTPVPIPSMESDG